MTVWCQNLDATGIRWGHPCRPDLPFSLLAYRRFILWENHGNHEWSGTAAVSSAAQAASRPDGARGNHGGGAAPRGRGRRWSRLDENTGDTFQAVRHRWGVAPVPGTLEGTQREGLAYPALCL